MEKKVLQRNKREKLTPEEINNIISPLPMEDIEFVVKCSRGENCKPRQLLW